MERRAGAGSAGQPAPDLREAPLRLLFAGTPDAAVPALRALLGSRHEVAAVLTRPDAPTGRGRKLVRSPIAALADEAGVPVLQPRRPSEPEFLAQLTELAPDAAPVVAYGALIPRAGLDIPRYGWLNLHFSLLPAWRGAAPVQHAVWRGDGVTGASVFALEEGLDTGPVYGTVTEEIRPRDTSGDLLARLSVSGAGLLVATLDALESGEVSALPQPADGITLAPKIEVADARVDWREPALAVDRRVRACTPAPGAWTLFRGERLKLGPVEPARDAAPLPPGVLGVGRRRVLVGTATHPVVLGEVTPQGKKPMAADAWARGVRPADGEALDTGDDQRETA